MQTIIIKIVIGLVGLSTLAGSAWWVKSLVKANAVLEASLESTTAAFGEYAGNVEAEVDAWSQAAQVLSEKYQLARDERNASVKRISQADFSTMASSHPNMLADRINRGTERLFNDLEAATRTRYTYTTSPAKTGATDLTADSVGGDRRAYLLDR